MHCTASCLLCLGVAGFPDRQPASTQRGCSPSLLALQQQKTPVTEQQQTADNVAPVLQPPFWRQHTKERGIHELRMKQTWRMNDIHAGRNSNIASQSDPVVPKPTSSIMEDSVLGSASWNEGADENGEQWALCNSWDSRQRKVPHS